MRNDIAKFAALFVLVMFLLGIVMPVVSAKESADNSGKGKGFFDSISAFFTKLISPSSGSEKFEPVKDMKAAETTETIEAAHTEGAKPVALEAIIKSETAVAPEVVAAVGIVSQPAYTRINSSSGKGYPTGLLNIIVAPTQLILDRVGAVKQAINSIEIKDRQYEASGALPVTINGVVYTATEIKLISNLKAKGGAGDHSGTVDIDIDPAVLGNPSGHIAFAYKGAAIVSGPVTASSGTYKTTKATGVLFAGLVAEGSYAITIIETGSVFGAPATVTITTASAPVIV